MTEDHTQTGLFYQQTPMLSIPQVGLYPLRMAKTKGFSELGARLNRAMTSRGMTEAQLVSELQKIAAGDEHAELRGKLSQQMVNHLTKRGGGERSFYIPLIAIALKVPSAWLAFGVGKDGLSKDQESRDLNEFPPASAAMIRAYDTLPREIQLPIQMLVQAVVTAGNDSHAKWSKNIEAFNKERDSASKGKKETTD